MEKDEDEKQLTKDTYKKPDRNEFQKEVRKEIVSHGDGLKEVYEGIYNYLDLDPSRVILITGETGVGKELVAEAIHKHGVRANDPFLSVNCAAFTETLLESELFGHKKGAFTGALRDKEGMFEEARGGILFLDEVADLSLEAQAKLLRVIEDKEIVKVGGSRKKPQKVDVKIIAATNKYLPTEIADGKFRIDLYQRLTGFPINIPPLRERPLDIPVLIRYFIEKENEKSNKNIERLDFRLFFFCITHEWPGNVRELRSFIEFCYTTSPLGNTMQFSDSMRSSVEKFPMQAVADKRGYPKSITSSVSAALFFMVLGWAVEHDREELKKLVKFNYENIPLDSIPEANGDQYEKMVKRDEAYRRFVLGLKQLYDKNLITLWNYLSSKYLPSKGDLFALPYKDAKVEFEKEWIKRALERNKGNRAKTAREMGISDEALRQKLKKFNL